MFLVVAVAFLVAVAANDTSESKCPQVTADSNFTISQIGTGELFDIARYIEPLIAKMGDCGIGKYELVEETEKLEFIYIENKKKLTHEGQAIYDNDTQKLIFTLSENGEVLFVVKFDVIYTDYENFFIIYNCNYDDETNTKAEMLWILSKFPKLDSDVTAKINNFLKNSSFIDINKLKWGNFSQESCKVKSE